ncbi:unnamed protein product [Bursaphelenchus okinawaensis]|uniref:G protein-coupled receptor n=1 Tax=Bursaphelenchus okinawaensis TaxID=465554 RepID=A0A811K3V1_9BILA|nr:unnamed protein product [Bursaphelenchus okinawaensis]CAG9090085.1 unnamed protein product [Bursaphelenchus okinawaensis]
MRENAGMTTFRAQKYVVKVMILQAFYPLILYFVPVFILMYSILTTTPFDVIGYVCSMSVQLFTLLSSLSVLVLIPTYRKTLIHRRASLHVTATKIYTNDGTFVDH